MNSFSNSWQLVKASWAILQKDKELIWFPILSSLVMIVVTIVFILPLSVIFAIFTGTSGYIDSSSGGNDIIGYALLFVYYLVSNMIVIFFNSALIAAATIRLDGGDPTLSDGLRIARERMGAIFGYALISATVGVILRFLRERGGILGDLLNFFGGIAWSVATFLVIPILVAKNISPIDAIKESALLLRRTWGEQAVGGFTMGAVFTVIFLVLIFGGIALIALAAALESSILIFLIVVMLILAIVLMSIISSALNGIYQAALYRYAESGTAPDDFDIQLIRGAFQDKNKRKN